MTRPGILALQGCVDPHVEMFKKLDVDAVEIKTSDELNQVDRLIIPGGESSTMLKLAKLNGMFDALKEFCKSKPVWGICAGAILLSKEIANPHQDSLQLIDVRATRNFYGSQLNSFKAKINIFEKTIGVDFIRAPKLDPLSDKVKVLADYENQPVLLQQDNILISAFHTELGTSTPLHEHLLSL